MATSEERSASPSQDPQRKLRVLMISSMYPPDHEGGAELSAQKFTNGLRELGHDVQVVTREWRSIFQGSRTEDPAWVHRILEGATVFRTMPNVVAQRVDTALAYRRATVVANVNVPRMEEFLRTREFDVVYAFETQGLSPLVVKPLTDRGVPVMWNISSHVLLKLLAPPKLLKISQALLCPSLWKAEQALPYEHFAYVSEFMRDLYAEHGIRPRHPYILRRGLEFPLPEESDLVTTDPPYFCVAGRITPAKGVHVVVEAAGKLLKTAPGPWSIEVYGGHGSGDEPYYQAVNARIQELGLGDRVLLKGQVPRPELLQRLRGASGMIVSSVYDEPGGNTVIEALGTGAPLIATDSGANVEILQGRKCGLIYGKEDSDLLASHLGNLLGNPRVGREMALEGLRLAKESYRFAPILKEAERILLLVAQSRNGLAVQS